MVIKVAGRAFFDIYHRAKAEDGRTNYSEVIKELMGFKPQEGVDPVTIPSDRAYLADEIQELIGSAQSDSVRKKK